MTLDALEDLGERPLPIALFLGLVVVPVLMAFWALMALWCVVSWAWGQVTRRC